MQLIQHIIRNKLVIYILSLAICIIGIACLFTTPFAPFPSLPGPQLNVSLSYPGADVNTVQSQVTEKIVHALRGTSNISKIIAMSRAGFTNISAYLTDGNKLAILQTEMHIMQSIQDSNLPSSVSRPKITQSAGVSGLTGYIISSKHRDLFELNNFAQAQLVPRFQSLPDVQLWTSPNTATIKIQLNAEKLAKYHLSPITISQYINQSNQNAPMGRVVIHDTPYLLSTNTQLNKLSSFKNLIVSYTGVQGHPIYLKDIATVQLLPLNMTPMAYSSFNGRIADSIFLYTTARANPFQSVKSSENRVAQVENNLPPDIKITQVFNQAKTMHDSFNEVGWTIAFAAMLIILVALVFLGHLRTTLIPIATIPICLLGAIIIVNLLGHTVNIMTLLGLVIAVGLVVDDAIVVVENITRLIESGMNKVTAVIEGTTSISLTIIGITLTLLAVYLPITFINNPFTIMVKAFAIPLAAAVFISGIVALTLTPIMCVLLLTDHKPSRYQLWFNKKLTKIIDIYQHLLSKVFSFPKTALFLCVITISAFGYIDSNLSSSYFPTDPDGTIVVNMTGTSQDTITSLKQRMTVFKPFYQNNTVEYYGLNIQHDDISGQITAKLNIHYKPKFLHQNITYANRINTFINKNKILNTSAHIQKYSNWGTGPDLSFYLYGTKNIKEINATANKLVKVMQNSHLFTSVNTTIHLPHKQIEFVIHKAKAAQFGIYPPQIKTLLSVAYGGYILNNHFSLDGLSLPIVIKLKHSDLTTLQSIEKLQIKSATTQKFYPLNLFVTPKMIAKPEIISTFNGHPMVQVNANLAKGIELSRAIPTTDHFLQKYAKGYDHEYNGNALHYIQGNKQTIMIFGLGLLSIYFLLTILFNSIIDPLIILLTVPFSIVGGALSLYIVGGNLNLYSVVGLITLVGLITKHGILIVQFANQTLNKGKDLQTAIMTATRYRFRPIIMTTLVMTLGALPLILNDNLMYVARRDLGIVLIGGLIIGTIFSLFIVPLVYKLIKNKKL